MRAAAEALGFEFPAAPSAVSPGEAWLIGAVVPSISHPFFANVIEQLESVFAQSGCDLLLRNSGGSVALESAIVQSLIERHVDGVVFIPCSSDMEPLKECAQILENRRDHPTDAHLPQHRRESRGRRSGRRPSISRNWAVAPVSSSALLRTRNSKDFKSYIESQRLTDFHVEAIDVDGWDESFVMDVHKAILERFDSDSIRRFDCIFAKTDLAAVGAIHALKDLGRSVPEDVAVCGFDDTPVAREVRPGLSSIAQPVGQIVRFGFAMLEKSIRGEEIVGQRSYSLKPHLAVRGSTFDGAAGLHRPPRP